MSELTTCPGCGRHCSVNNLQCPRGEQIVGRMQGQSQSTEPFTNHYQKPNFENSQKEIKQEITLSKEDQLLFDKIKTCGLYFHSISKDNEIIQNALSKLTTEEKSQLYTLLEKIEINEKAIKAPKGHHGHHHGHRYFHKGHRRFHN